MDIEIPNRAIATGNSLPSQNRSNVRRLDSDKADNVGNTSSVVSPDVNESEQDKTQRLENSVSELNAIVQSVQRDLQFSIDEFSGDTVIKVLDTKTDEVIRQIPSEEVLALTRNIESLKGVLFSAEV